MTYRLEVHIDDMSRAEAVAVVTAIIQRHGQKLVLETVKMDDAKAKNQPANSVGDGPYKC